MTFPVPPAYHANRAAQYLNLASNHVAAITLAGNDRIADAHWQTATGHLQDALAELGFDLVPLRKAPPATADSLFGPADYAASVGGL